MNISCAICGDIFLGLSPDEAVYTTACGHLFHYNCLIEWFERSKTCPQCRQKTTEKNITRIYFSNAHVSNPDVDPAVLKFRVESLEFQLKMNEKEMKTINEEKRTALKKNKGLIKEVKELSSKLVSSEQKLDIVTDELKSLKSYCKQLSEVKSENEALKKELVACKSVDMIVNGTTDEADCVVDNSDLSSEYLQQCVKYFKKRIKNLESEHKNTEKEILFYKKKVASQNKMLSELEEKYESLKAGRRLKDNSIIQISDDDSDVMVSFENELSSHKGNLHDKETYRSCTEADKTISMNLLEDSLLEDSSYKKMRLSKPVPSYQSKSTSLLGVTQPKLQFRIPKLTSSLTSVVGDDSFHPAKYDTAGKVTKKYKKQLSSTSVSTLERFVKNKENKISDLFQDL